MYIIKTLLQQISTVSIKFVKRYVVFFNKLKNSSEPAIGNLDIEAERNFILSFTAIQVLDETVNAEKRVDKVLIRLQK